MNEPLVFVVTFVLRIVALTMLLRFVLQAVRASFYNPFCEGIAKVTDPLLLPLRRFIRPYKNLDTASFSSAWLMHALVIAIQVWVNDWPMNWLFVLNDSLHTTLNWVINIFIAAIVVTIVMSWFAPGVYSPAAAIAKEIAEPALAPARKLLPPFAGLDLSPMLTVLVLFMIQSFVLTGLLPYRLWSG